MELDFKIYLKQEGNWIFLPPVHYNENLSEEENNVYNFSFEVSKNDLVIDGVNFFNLIKNGRVLKLVLTKPNKTIYFVINSISPTSYETNMVLNVSCVEWFSFIMSRNNIGLTLDTMDTSSEYWEWLEREGLIHNVSSIVKYILFKGYLRDKNGIGWNLIENNTSLIPLNLQVTDSNTFNALIELCNLLDAALFVRPETKELELVFKQDGRFKKNFFLSPYFNLQDLSLSYQSENHYPIYNVLGGKDENGFFINMIPLLNYSQYSLLKNIRFTDIINTSELLTTNSASVKTFNTAVGVDGFSEVKSTIGESIFSWIYTNINFSSKFNGSSTIKFKYNLVLQDGDQPIGWTFSEVDVNGSEIVNLSTWVYDPGFGFMYLLDRPGEALVFDGIEIQPGDSILILNSQNPERSGIFGLDQDLFNGRNFFTRGAGDYSFYNQRWIKILQGNLSKNIVLSFNNGAGTINVDPILYNVVSTASESSEFIINNSTIIIEDNSLKFNSDEPGANPKLTLSFNNYDNIRPFVEASSLEEINVDTYDPVNDGFYKDIFKLEKNKESRPSLETIEILNNVPYIDSFLLDLEYYINTNIISSASAWDIKNRIYNDLRKINYELQFLRYTKRNLETSILTKENSLNNYSEILGTIDTNDYVENEQKLKFEFMSVEKNPDLLTIEDFDYFNMLKNYNGVREPEFRYQKLIDERNLFLVDFFENSRKILELNLKLESDSLTEEEEISLKEEVAYLSGFYDSYIKKAGLSSSPLIEADFIVVDNVDISAALGSIQGLPLSHQNIVLLTGQTNESENGLYRYSTAQPYWINYMPELQLTYGNGPLWFTKAAKGTYIDRVFMWIEGTTWAEIFVKELLDLRRTGQLEILIETYFKYLDLYRFIITKKSYPFMTYFNYSEYDCVVDIDPEPECPIGSRASEFLEPSYALWDLEFTGVKQKFITQDGVKQDFWFNLKSDYQDFLSEGFYENEVENDSISLYKQALETYKYYKRPNEEYSATYIDAGDLIGQNIDLIEVGDIIKIAREPLGLSDYEENEIRVTNVNRELRNKSNISLGVDNLKTMSSIIQKLLSSVAKK